MGSLDRLSQAFALRVLWPKYTHDIGTMAINTCTECISMYARILMVQSICKIFFIFSSSRSALQRSVSVVRAYVRMKFPMAKAALYTYTR